MTEPITVDELADLLVETGHHHHQSYISSEGIDPEWALWYAGYLQTRIWDRAGTLPTRSALVHLLIEAEKRYGTAEGWPPAYAQFLLDNINELA